MKILFFSIKPFEKPFLDSSNRQQLPVTFTEKSLAPDTVDLAVGYDAISVFTNDDVTAPVIKRLSAIGVKYIATRAAGYDNIDISVANDLGIRVANVPEYSPYSIAEHAVALILALNRKLVLADRQLRGHNFTVDKLLGFDLHRKKVGVIGTGRIGQIFAKIISGFGCEVLAYDLSPDIELQRKYHLRYCTLEELLQNADIISLHVPLNEGTRHLVDSHTILQMKRGVMLINTARGAVVDTQAVLQALDNGTIGYYGMDVYEKENGLFFFDRSGDNLNDPLLDKLMSFPNVLITPHQGFATHEAVTNIADTTFNNLYRWSKGAAALFELH